MSTPQDQLLARIMGADQAAATGSAVPSLLDRVMGTSIPDLAPAVPEDERSLLDKTGDVLGSLSSFVAWPFSEPARGTVVSMGRGIASGAVLDPIIGVLSLPGAFTNRRIVTDRMADFFRRGRQGFLTEGEQYALQTGLTPQEVATANGVGQFLGFVAPVSASIKGAQLLLRAPQKLSRHVISGPLTTDLVAGLIYGGVFKEEDTLTGRVEHAFIESALFGVGRLVITGMAAPFFAWRNNRLNSQGVMQEMRDRLTRWEAGEPVHVDKPEDGIALARLQSEESYISSSPAAQAILAESADENALVAAIVDVANHGHPSGVVRIGSDLGNALNVVSRMKERFPQMAFSQVRREGQYHVFFGPRGLNNVQKKQFKQRGIFEGALIHMDDATYEYVGQAAKKGQIQVRLSDGVIKDIPDTGYTLLPTFRELDAPSPHISALFDDFWRWADDKVTAVRNSWDDPALREQVVRDAREGRLPFDDTARRDLNADGVIAHPELAGMQGQALAGSEAAALTEAGMLDAIQRMTSARAPTWDELFDAWALQRGIPREASDYLASKAHFAQRARQEFWKMVPEEDKAIFNALRDENIRLSAENPLPFEALAHGKGFHVEYAMDGKVSLRDIYTGIRYSYGSEGMAAKYLREAYRAEGELIGAPFPLGGAGIKALTGGHAPTDGVFTFGEHVQDKDFITSIPFTWVQNFRDLLVRLEESSGVQLWSGVFDRLHTGLNKQRSRYEPYGLAIAQAFRGLNRNQRIEVAKFWSEVEGLDMPLADALRRAREYGLSPRQIDAFKQGHLLLREGFALSGIESSRYIHYYYSRVQPYAANLRRGESIDEAALRRIFQDLPDIPPEFRWSAQYQRVGELAEKEMDPEMVLHKYFRSMFFDQEVAPAFSKARELMGMRLRDLPQEMRDRIITSAHASGNTSINPGSHVLTDPLRNMLSEYLHVIRGTPTANIKTLRLMTEKMFQSLKIEGDPRVLEEYMNIMISSMYGAAMAARPSLVARNMSQNLWMMFSRIGGKYAGRGMERAMTQEGYMQARNAGAIPAQTSGVPLHDVIWEQVASAEMLAEGGITSIAARGVLQKGLRMGQISRKVSEKLMVPYSSSDQASRAWAFHWQRMHTEDWLTRFETGKIAWEKATEEGLAFFAKPVRDRFSQIYNAFGKDQALDFIGRVAADESNFIYGAGAQPMWMQTAVGRLFGMFGTWPLWALEHYYRRIGMGTRPQQAAMIARTMAMTAAFSNMTIQSGIALWNWMAPTSIGGWAGGPAVDHFMNLRAIAEAPAEEKIPAMGRWAKNVGRLSFPGQIMLNDVRRALENPDPLMGGAILLLGKPVDGYSDIMSGNFALDFIYNDTIRNNMIFDPVLRDQHLRETLNPLLFSNNIGRMASPYGPTERTSEWMRIRGQNFDTSHITSE